MCVFSTNSNASTHLVSKPHWHVLLDVVVLVAREALMRVTVFSDLAEDVYSLKQFNTDLIVAATLQCIKVINGDTDLPSTLPPGMSARFRMGASLANSVQVCFLFVCLPVLKKIFLDV